MVIIAGEIDLSVGALLALISVAIGIVLHDTPYDLGFDPRALTALGVALLIGLFAGLLNGLVTVYGKIPSFIVTLGTLSIFRGLALTYNNSSPQPVLNQSFLEIFSGAEIFGLPIIVLYLAIALLLTQYLLRGTLFGVQVYATGGNREASRMAGIPTNRVRVAVMALAGLLTGFAAVLATARVRTALPTLGVGLELDAIAAAILGGTRLSGGHGRIVGTLLGAMLIGVINNGLTLLGVPSTLQDVIKGCLIILAVLAIRLRRGAGEGRRLAG
jgi:ribose/xylose/arabinose/galactoside ABC-type transport system permease subunit